MLNSFSLVLLWKNVDFFLKNGCFSERIWPDLGNTAWVDMARLGSIGLGFIIVHGMN